MGWFSAPDYWLGRLALERGAATIYLIAFVAAAVQFRALIGEQGILPVPRFLAEQSFWRTPSVFHLRYSDRLFATVCWFGATLSVVIVAGAADLVPLWVAMLMWLTLWLLYLSIVNVGQAWYSFGWESLLLETGFLLIFLGNDRTGPPVLTLWVARLLLFRVEFGAGLIKMRGDSCWRDLTCLYYHHETQPMPGPLSWFFHHLPKPLHRIEVAGNHFAQLVVPFGLFTPQPGASVAAVIIVVTQLWLVTSGNFAWLNWLTIVLACSAIDQSWAARLCPEFFQAAHPGLASPPSWFVALVIAFAGAVLFLSYWPVRNLLSSKQRMNASFNPFHLVNTYGAFGSIGRVRREVVIEGTEENKLTRQTVWREYEFKGKPGSVRRLPRQWAPYHLRLDWLMWFAAISPAYAQQWLPPLLQRLLHNDRAALRLLRHNPFPESPPRYLRAQLYQYRFTTPAELRRDRAWWHRTLIGGYVAPMVAAPTTNHQNC
jgi:Lipase maturation factor